MGRRAAREPEFVIRARASEEALGVLGDHLAALTPDDLARHLVRVEQRIASMAMPRTIKGGQTAASTFAAQAVEFARQHHGVRGYEIARAIGQTLPSVGRTLMSLRRQGRLVRHGAGKRTLWTVPGVMPRPRVDDIPDAIRKVATDANTPLDGRQLVESVKHLMREAHGQAPQTESVTSSLYRLVQDGQIVKEGANEHGPMYRIAEGATTGEPIN